MKNSLKKVNYIKRTVIETVLFLFVGFISLGSLYAGNKSVGIWVVRDQLRSQHSIDNVIEFAEENEVTTLFVQLVGRGYAYYDSEIIPRSNKIKNQDFNPLEYLFKKTEDKDINIHAWLNILLVWSHSDKLQNESEHIISQNPEWLTHHKDGNNMLAHKKKYLRKKGISGRFLEPAHPEVKQYCSRLVKELVKKYNIDGIHLDYIRYPGPNFGYCKRNRNLFKKKVGKDPVNIAKENEDSSGYNDMALKWKKFRQNKVDSIVYMLHEDLKGKKIRLSAAVKPDLYRAKLYYLQNWGKWLKKDWVDFVVPMNYTADKGAFYRTTREIAKYNEATKIWMGIGTYNQTQLQTDRQVEIIKNSNYSGVAFFSYKSTVEKDIYIKKYGLDK